MEDSAQESHYSQPMIPKKIHDKKALVFWATAILTVVGFAYALYVNLSFRSFESKNSSSIASSFSNSWKKYTNSKYGYSILYPNNWNSSCSVAGSDDAELERVCLTEKVSRADFSPGIVVQAVNKDKGLHSKEYVNKSVLRLDQTGDLKVLDDLKYLSGFDMTVVDGFQAVEKAGPHAYFVNDPEDDFAIEIIPEGVDELSLRRLYGSFSFPKTADGIAGASSETDIRKFVDESSTECSKDEIYKDYEKALANASSVCRLDLTEYGLPSRTALPTTMDRFINLKELILVNNSLLTELPKEIYTLKKLTRLNLTNIPLREFPKEITTLSSLKYLDWKGQDFARVPGEVGNLRRLIRLNLDGIPASVGSHSKGKLQDIPNDLIHIKTLKTLDLSNNIISTIPPLVDSMTWLQTLNLTNTPVPEARVSKLKQSLPNTKILY